MMRISFCQELHPNFQFDMGLVVSSVVLFAKGILVRFRRLIEKIEKSLVPCENAGDGGFCRADAAPKLENPVIASQGCPGSFWSHFQEDINCGGVEVILPNRQRACLSPQVVQDGV